MPSLAAVAVAASRAGRVARPGSVAAGRAARPVPASLAARRRQKRQVRADAGKVVTSTCLFHGKHQVQVHWVEVEVEVWVLQVVRGQIEHERVVAYIPEFGVACTSACGPRFGWGRGCEH